MSKDKTMTDKNKQAADLLREFKGARFTFGLGCFSELGPATAAFGTRAAVVASGFGKPWGPSLHAEIADALAAAGVEIAGEIIPGAKPNSPMEDVFRVAELLNERRPNVVLDEPAHGEGPSLAEILADSSATLPGDRVERAALAGTLREALATLDDRERRIIECYYGLGAQGRMSLEAIGSSIRLSRERVRQIRNRAFAKIREACHGPALAEFLS